MDEAILIEQIQIGDKHAFEIIFKSYYSHLCSYANKFLNDKDEAEEIVQETFFQYWQKREIINITTSFKSYIFRAVHNGCLNFIKHKDIQKKHIDHTIYANKTTSIDSSSSIETNELQKKIRDAIEKLPPERKKIFIMIRYEEMKYMQVAEKLSISIKTVENQMGSALKFLREELKEYLPLIILSLINIFK